MHTTATLDRAGDRTLDFRFTEGQLQQPSQRTDDDRPWWGLFGVGSVVVLEPPMHMAIDGAVGEISLLPMHTRAHTHIDRLVDIAVVASDR